MRLHEAARRPLVDAYNLWLALKSSREHSVKNIARSNTRKSFERIYGSETLLSEYLSPERLAFYDELAELCAAFRPRRVIDVGCGPGHLLAAVASRAPQVEVVVGVDYASAAIDRLSRLLPRARGIVASVYDLGALDERFDVVACTEVLEHLHRPTEALAVLQGLCAPAGHVVVTVPDGEQDSYEGHVNFWTESEFGNILAPFGPTHILRSSGGDLIGVVAPT
jgi:2-polyprenyl-3-methyl-5-hydroxy-6-metoxy-1,4-benzoquinol methylase